MTFACFFRGLCAFLCAFGKIAQFENTHFAMKSCKKALKTYVFKAFSWSEWRDSNSSMGKTGCDTPYFFVLRHALFKESSINSCLLMLPPDRV